MQRSRPLVAALAVALAACDCGGGTITAAPVIVVTAGPLDFGPHVVGGVESNERYVEIRNTGRAALSVVELSLVQAPGDTFGLRAALLRDCNGALRPDPRDLVTPGDCARLIVAFAPPARGLHEATLRIESDDPATPLVELVIRGEGVGPVARACALAAGEVVNGSCTDPADFESIGRLDFGGVPVGARVERHLRVFNDGRAPLHVGALVLEPAEAPFSVVGALPVELEPGASAEVVIAFVPPAQGPSSATLRIPSDDDERPTLSITLEGAGTVPILVACLLADDGTEVLADCTDLLVEPPLSPTIDFGVVLAFETRTRTIRLRNTGTAPLVVAETELQTLNDDLTLRAPWAGTLEPGATAELVVDFAPVAEGRRGGVVVIASNDPRQPFAEVLIQALAAGPHLCVEPPLLNFGDVVVGQERVLEVALSNCGLVPWTLETTTLRESDAATLEYALLNPPPVPQVYAPGDAFTAQVRYRPAAQRVDAGSLDFAADLISNSVLLTGKGGPPSCVAVAPVANAGADLASRPLGTVTLDGRASSSPRPGGVTHQWRILSQPANAGGALSSATIARPELTTPIAGDYVLELVVRDSANCQSAPDTVTVHAAPDARLHILVTWSQEFGDVDTHFVGPGGTFWTRGDTFFGNRTPDWGAGNTVAADGSSANDPRLDKDDTWGRGPENVNQDVLFDGDFQVKLHYYCSRRTFGSSYGDATATVMVFVDGLERYSGTVTMRQRDVFDAATVRVSAGGTRVDVLPVNAALYKSATSQGCTRDGD